MRRRWIWISVISVLGVILLGALLASPIAASRAKSEAGARGLHLEMGAFELGWFEAEMRDVNLQLKGVKQVRVEIERVVVEFSLSRPRLRSVVAENGKVSITGSVDEVRDALEKWRGQRPNAPARSAEGPRRKEILRNFDLSWSGAWGGEEKQIISGLSAERGEKGLLLGADLVEVSRGDLSAQIAGAILETPSSSFDLSQAKKLGAAEMRVTITAAEPVPEAKPDEGAKPDEDAKPDQDAKPEAKPTSAASDDGLEDRLEKNEARVARLLAALDFLRHELAGRLPQAARVEKLWLTYRRGEERLHIGPSLLALEKKGEDLFVGVTPQGKTKGTPLSLELTVKPKSAKKAAAFSLRGGPVSLSTLGVSEGAFGLSGVEHTQISGTLTAELNQEGTVVQGGGQAQIDGLALDSRKLSERLVTFPKLSLAGKGEMQIDGSRYQLQEATLRMGDTSFQGAFSMERGVDYVTLSAQASAPLVSCQALLDSAPRGLLGDAERIRFDGTFSLDASVEADTRKLDDMQVRWDFKNGCRVKAVPGQLDPEQFRGLFRREVIGAGNFPMELEFGPLSTSWVPWDEVSPFVEKALLVTEDGRFFRHDGFDDRAIESAIRDNVKNGRFVRGASTISMQLAKNLYLSRTKTLARKFQEAALTSLLEQSFEKRELLELYVNVVEFGPGIYGIRQAAEHYFSTVPGRLTPAQAFFLASILPAPTRNYFDADGTLQEYRQEYVRRLLKISHGRGALTDLELEEALEEELVFGQPLTRPEKLDEEPGDAGKVLEKKSADDKKAPPAPRNLDEGPIFPAR